MIFAVGFTIWLSALSLAGLGTWLALRHFKSSPPHLDAPFGLYPVSVLKPLKGTDPGLRENLRSFFLLEYPAYEIIFSVPAEGDPAIQVVKELLQEYSHVQASLIIGGVELGPNPKVNNLVRSYAQARYDWIVISDSNVRVEASYLKRLVAHMDSTVGVVTSIVQGRGGQGIGGGLETVFLNSFYARGMCLAQWAGKPCVMGKSMLFRRSTAERFGGIKILSRFLAEDYMTGIAMKKLGLKVAVASDPVPQIIGDHSLESFWNRHMRWGRIRKSHAPLAFLVEPCIGTIISGLVGAISCSRLFEFPPAPFFLLHLLLFFWLDLKVINAVTKKKTSLSIAPLWLTRELLAPLLWAGIASGRTVKWRGQTLTLDKGGILLEKS